MQKIIDKRNYIIWGIIIILIVFLLINFTKEKEYSCSYKYFNHNIVVKIYENKNVFSDIDKIYKKYNKAYHGKNNKLLNEIINYGKEVYKETNGYIDISKKNLNKNFKTKISNLKTDSNELVIDDIIGALATTEVINYLKKNKVKEYLISDNGDISVGNYYQKGTFKISINNPLNNDILDVVSLENKSMVTRNSSDKVKSYMISPIQKEVVKKYDTVVVIAEDILTANMLANTLYLMDYEEGREFIKKYNASSYWYYDGKVKTYKFDKYLGD